jgi:hypothetical protein
LGLTKSPYPHISSRSSLPTEVQMDVVGALPCMHVLTTAPSPLQVQMDVGCLPLWSRMHTCPATRTSTASSCPWRRWSGGVGCDSSEPYPIGHAYRRSAARSAAAASAWRASMASYAPTRALAHWRAPRTARDSSSRGGSWRRPVRGTAAPLVRRAGLPARTSACTRSVPRHSPARSSRGEAEHESLEKGSAAAAVKGV